MEEHGSPRVAHTHARTPLAVQGNWGIFGMVLKLVKNLAKHEGPCAVLARSPNMGRLLLGVARLLARLPEQRKLLKVGRGTVGPRSGCHVARSASR